MKATSASSRRSSVQRPAARNNAAPLGRGGHAKYRRNHKRQSGVGRTQRVDDLFGRRGTGKQVPGVLVAFRQWHQFLAFADDDVHFFDVRDA